MKIARFLLLLSIALLSLPAGAAGRSEPAVAAFERAIEDAKAAMMVADPEAALGRSEAALVKADALPPSMAARGRATALWLKIEAQIGLNRLSDAEELLKTALPLAQRHAPNTKLHGDLVRARGAIAGLRGHMQEALRDFLAAHRIFRLAGEERSQAIALQDVGQLYWDAGDFERMLRYYDQAQELYDADPGFSLTTHNNRGEALRMLGRRAEAEREYKAALANARALDSSLLEMRVLSNLAQVQSELGKFSDAQRNAERALHLSSAAEAAEWRPFVYGTLAKIADARKDDRRAEMLLEKVFAGVDLARTDVVYKEFHRLAAELYERIDKPEQALAHLKAFQRLDSDARDLTASASSQMLAARFDFANQDLRIAQLKQGQLERDVQIERQRVNFRTTLFGALSVAGAIVLGLVTFAFFSLRRSRNEVRATNAVLTEVNHELENALKAKTDFLAMTSHEIRTPLNGILGMTQVMLANGRLAAEEREQVQLVHGAGQTMRALVDDILDVAKMETGEIVLEVEPTQLRPILDAAIALWRPKAAEKGLVLEAKMEGLPPLIETDGGKVRQIVFNLLSNVIKFTPEGSVRLLAACDRTAGSLCITVEDTGIGIPRDQQAKVFEAFHQVDSAMARRFSGTGLGLAICRNLAEALGGSIRMESELGRGSRFLVTLPLKEAEETAGAERPAALAEVRLGVLEANEIKRGKIKGLVEPHVRTALDAADSMSALDLLDQGAVDHLLIDASSIEVEGLDPLVTLARIVERAAEREVRTTILLPAGSDISVDAVAALQPAAVLVKPVKGADLMRSLRSDYRQVNSEPFARVA